MATKKALLAGINNYQSVSDLRGCISDVEKFQSLLTDVFEFSPQNIHTLRDEEVVKDKIEAEWKWLLKGAKPGDSLVFMFAGHGSMTADTVGDEEDEPDGVDELLCLYDMDFDNPESYLLDDEIHHFTRRLPDGVSLTILFDSCHSGTATRMLFAPSAARSISPAKAPLVDLETTAARAGQSDSARGLALGATAPVAIPRLLAPETAEANRQVVLVRYIEPPPKVLDVMYRKGTRSGFQRRKRTGKRSMNHVFFAGCQSGQTSADAHIESGFHGAFSYYFCQAVRAAGVQADQPSILRDVRTALSQSRFSQIPQLEPETTKGPLFGGRGKPSAGAGPAKVPDATVAAPAAESPAAEPPAAAIEPHQQILALLNQILAELKERPARLGGTARVSGERALVYVHGICRHEAGYSDGWWRSLKPHLSATMAGHLEDHRREVLWSQHVTAPRALPRDAVTPAAVLELEEREREVAESLQDVIADRAIRDQMEEMPAADRGLGDNAPLEPTPVVVVNRAAIQARGLNCIDDFARYLLWNSIRRAVQKEFLDVVLPLLEAGHAVDVIAHSWGTVAAYEALRTLDNRQLDGQVLNLFTVASALSIGPVQRRLEIRDGDKPRHVRRWVNLDARRDLVGGPLARMGYQVDEEFLNLVPVGCRLVLDGPWCPHSSYFHEGNVAINRDIFAARMQS